MRVTVDLGFPSLVVVLLACVVVPAIGFVVRLKWRRAVARAEEVRRLLVLAAEESARAESEAAYQYYDGAVSVAAKSNQCAVCFCPTTTRCARCKAVHYWYVYGCLVRLRFFFEFLFFAKFCNFFYLGDES